MAKLFLSLLLVQMDPARGMAFPVPAVAAAVVAPVFGMLGFRRAQRQSDAFFSMDWSQDVSDNGDACVIVGEETAPNGKIWCGASLLRSICSVAHSSLRFSPLRRMVCNEPAQDPDTDCLPVSGDYTNRDANDDQWLCKQSKP